MKAIIHKQTCLIALLVLIIPAFSQAVTNQPIIKKEIKMEKPNENNLQLSFIDKFFVPKGSVQEFKQQMNYNRKSLSNLSGYINGAAFEQTYT